VLAIVSEGAGSPDAVEAVSRPRRTARPTRARKAEPEPSGEGSGPEAG
jgi:hypothetical protein